MKRYFFGDMHFKEDSDRIKWSEDNTEYLKMFQEIPFEKDDIVFFAGDIFDKTKHKGDVNRAVLDFFIDLSGRVQSIYVIQGNHELSKYSGSNLDILINAALPNVHIISDIEVFTDSGGKKVLGVPHRIERDWDKVYSMDENVDYVISHTFQKENTMFGSYGLDSSLFKFEYNYFFSGHNHLFEKIHDKSYCLGSLKPLDPGEQGYDFKYIIIENEVLSEVKIDISRFYHFKFFEYDIDPDPEYNPKELLYIYITCSKDDMLPIMENIRKSYKNVYYSEWKLKEEELTNINVTTDENLITSFFKTKEYSKEVVDTFQSYFQGDAK
jgi:DNA repair exonuclease SbcCD nuclease subunit